MLFDHCDHPRCVARDVGPQEQVDQRHAHGAEASVELQVQIEVVVVQRVQKYPLVTQ